MRAAALSCRWVVLPVDAHACTRAMAPLHHQARAHQLLPHNRFAQDGSIQKLPHHQSTLQAVERRLMGAAKQAQPGTQPGELLVAVSRPGGWVGWGWGLAARQDCSRVAAVTARGAVRGALHQVALVARTGMRARAVRCVVQCSAPQC